MKLSFIIPIYNVAPYLRKCVDSLLAQDYSDYEIILVDDGSTDNSGAICDEYTSPSFASLHHCIIRTIHQQNAGLSAARNAGLKVAKGEYICFVDSDDYWQPNVLAGLIAQIERDKLDVLRFKYQHVNELYEVFDPYKRDHRLENDYSDVPTDGVSFLNSRMNTQCYAVMFILRRDLIMGEQKSFHHSINSSFSSVLFTEGIFFEDTDWTPRMLCCAKRVASTDTIVYNYLVREGSITNAVNREKKKKILDDKMRLIKELKKMDTEIRDERSPFTWFDRMIADTVISIIGMLSYYFYDERDIYISQLKQLDVYPIVTNSAKSRLINISAKLAVELLHLKNGK